MNPDEVLGKGSFSTVYKGVDIQTNNPVAIKTLGLNENDCKLEMFRKEVRNL
jgi:serine/threonine protein kinase